MEALTIEKAKTLLVPLRRSDEHRHGFSTWFEYYLGTCIAAGCQPKGEKQVRFRATAEYPGITFVGKDAEELWQIGEAHTVLCQTCGKACDCVHRDPTLNEGYGCSTNVFERDQKLEAYGGYASRFTGYEMNLTLARQKPRPGLTCDSCITLALDTGGERVVYNMGCI